MLYLSALEISIIL